MKLTVEFEWDGEKLGGRWFNMEALDSCLFGIHYINQDTDNPFLKVREIKLKLPKTVVVERKAIELFGCDNCSFSCLDKKVFHNHNCDQYPK